MLRYLGDGVVTNSAFTDSSCGGIPAVTTKPAGCTLVDGKYQVTVCNDDSKGKPKPKPKPTPANLRA